MKEEKFSIDGTVLEVLRGGLVKIAVTIDSNERNIIGYVNGKMKQEKILIVAGDRVRLIVSPYDITKGIITYRYKAVNNNIENGL